jgi:hypothetical protein
MQHFNKILFKKRDYSGFRVGIGIENKKKLGIGRNQDWKKYITRNKAGSGLKTDPVSEHWYYVSY